MEERLQVGVIASTHGVRGEVKVFPTTDDVRRFKKLKEVILDTGKETCILEIEQVKFFKQFAILKFKGIDTLDEVEKYRKKSLYVTRENAVRLKKDEYFIADLIGLKVLGETGEELGELEDVIETGANDVYQIKMNDGRQLLLPAIRQCILDVNVEEGFMKELGELEDVIETGANDVYQIKMNDGRQLLLPAIRQCILDVNVEEGFMKIHILEGLLD